MHQTSLVRRSGPHLLHWIGAERVESEEKKQSTADKFNPERHSHILDDIDNKREAVTCHQCIYDVAQRSSHTRCQTEMAPLVQSTLHGQNANRPHWCRRDDTNDDALHNHFEDADILQNLLIVKGWELSF